VSRSRLSFLFLIVLPFLALPATAIDGESTQGGAAPRPNCGAHVVFERFQQVVLENILKHVLDEKNPELWAEAFAGGAGSRYRIHLDPSALRITFVSPRGHYVIGVSDQVDRDRLGDLVDNELPRVLVRNNGADAAPTVVSTIGIHPDWLADGAVETAPNAARHLEHLRGLVRAAFAGDAYLHPQQKAPDAAPADRFVESAIQQVTIQGLSTLYRFSMLDDAGRPLRMGLMAPGGIGKTFLCARFMRAVFEAEKVVLVVDNNDILDQSRFAYAREFGLRVGELLTIYDNLSQGVLDPNRRILLINRTMLNRRWDEVVAWMGNARTGFVFDEAHHLGRGQGAREFQQIFDRFNSDPRMLANIARQAPQRPHYLGLLASATFWHGDTDLIVNPTYLGVRNLPAGTRPYGKIYGPLLHDDERILITRNFGRNQQRIVDMGTEPEALRRGEATPEIARRQLLRAMGLGYLARLSHSDLHEDVIRGPNGEELPAFEVVRRIDAREVKIERTSIAYQLLEKVYQQLVGMRSHTAGDVSRSVPPEQIAALAPSPNRVLVLVRRTQVANEVRDQLRAIAAAHGDGNTEVRTVHTSPGSDNREDTLAWFRSEGAYDNPGDRAVNKVLVVDQLVNEGVDVPETKGLIWILCKWQGHYRTLRPGKECCHEPIVRC
jgi:hypothetical protein